MLGFTARFPLTPKSTATLVPPKSQSPHHGALLKPQGQSLASFWPLYERLIDQRNRSADDDRTRWKQFIEPHLGSRRPEDITRADVYALLDGMGRYSPASRQRVLALLRRLFNWSIEVGLYFGTNPCSRVRIFVDNTRTRVLSDSELQRLLDGLQLASVRLRLIVSALIWTGKRRSELRTLTWPDVDLERGLVTLRATNTKAKRTQAFPLNSKALEVFQEAARLRVSDYVFPAASGVLYWELGKHWQRFRATIGLDDVWLHDLRRTAISRWARAGLSPLVIQRLSGHATLSMVMRYCQLAPEDVREASEALCGRSGAL